MLYTLLLQKHCKSTTPQLKKKKMRSNWRRVGFESSTSSVLIKRQKLDIDKHTGRMSCEDEGRDQGGDPISQEHQRWPANHQLGERPGTDSLSQPSEGTNSAETLILDIQPPEL